MSTSDIYHVKEAPGVQKPNPPKSRRRHQKQQQVKSFDETMQKDITKTNRRRQKNSGFRRFRHLMKKPDFNRTFWITVFSILGAILTVLVIWDRVFR